MKTVRRTLRGINPRTQVIHGKDKRYNDILCPDDEKESRGKEVGGHCKDMTKSLEMVVRRSTTDGGPGFGMYKTQKQYRLGGKTMV